jgi:hypothetical protein
MPITTQNNPSPHTDPIQALLDELFLALIAAALSRLTQPNPTHPNTCPINTCPYPNCPRGYDLRF